MPMDILGQYEKQSSGSSSQGPAWKPSQEIGEGGSLVQFVIRLSGGKIKDARQATYILFAFAGIMILASLLIFFGRGSGQENAFPPNFIQIDQSQYGRKK